MTDFNTNTTNGDSWVTPPYIIEALGPFDLDPCCPVNMPHRTATVMLTKADDGLTAPYHGRVWFNPPYGRGIGAWYRRMADHGNGTALIFCRTDTKAFHELIFPFAHAFFFLEGRVAFIDCNSYPDGEKPKSGNRPNAPSVLVAYSAFDTQRFLEAKARGLLKGHVVVNARGGQP